MVITSSSNTRADSAISGSMDAVGSSAAMPARTVVCNRRGRNGEVLLKQVEERQRLVWQSFVEGNDARKLEVCLLEVALCDEAKHDLRFSIGDASARPLFSVGGNASLAGTDNRCAFRSISASRQHFRSWLLRRRRRDAKVGEQRQKIEVLVSLGRAAQECRGLDRKIARR
jgi:hypothetical protein